MQTVADDARFSDFADLLLTKVQLAGETIYQADAPTQCDVLKLGSTTIYAKREDTSQIHSYKWRGSFFKMNQAVAAGYAGKFVAASAGNHAQGVALSAKKLQRQAIIFMPTTTPLLKQTSTQSIGEQFVEIRLVGDSYDEAADAAKDYIAENQAMMVKPFDDPDVIAGQAMVGVELLEQRPDTTIIYVPIGGGGLASGVAFAVKQILNIDCKIIGVEVENQNSMQQSIRKSKRISLDTVDTFCDGTAVRLPGHYTFEICSALLDDVITVSNEQVCAAIQTAWESGRFVPEPSGAVALAAAMAHQGNDAAEQVAVIITGSNMDFRTFPRVVLKSLPIQTKRRYFKFEINETNGSLIQLLDQFMTDLNIVDFQYGKTDGQFAHPVLGIEGPREQLDQLVHNTDQLGIKADEISGNSLSEFRVIPFSATLCHQPLFLKVDFPNRPGSLRDLMRQISSVTNICYFNFVESGELQGHALIGFELLSEQSETSIHEAMHRLGLKFKSASR